MTEVRYLRKRLGGGMRQVGVLAAAARVALASRARLAEDHVLATRLAELLADRFPDSVDLSAVETNMVKVRIESLGMSWQEISSRLKSSSIVAGNPRSGMWRLVTHRDVDSSDAHRLIAALS